MRILLLSRYQHLGASSRYRSYQYLPYLRSRGHEVVVSPLLSDIYMRRLYAGESTPVFDVLRSYWRRVSHLLGCGRYDLVWIEYESLPWIPYGLERLLRGSSTPYVVDYDDAVFHRYDMHHSGVVRRLLGRKIDGVMMDAAAVIAGNDYLAERARAAGARTVVTIPTVIDLGQCPGTPLPRREPFTIGWVGSPSTSRYLASIEEALRKVCAGTGSRVIAVGDPGLRLRDVPLESRPWNEATENEEISRFDVGIMPLSDSPWERGKCGLKLVKYMGCARAVVASPVGVNRSIVEDGVNGFLATGTAQWVDALTRLRQDFALRQRMGLAGRAKVERQYSLQTAAPVLASILEQSQRPGH
jgi:glycosyltransferase involved in cell wall biosynthesis